MRRDNCTSNFRYCNTKITCSRCIIFERLDYLESRVATLELQNADQAQLINSLVYKHHNEYMKFPF